MRKDLNKKRQITGNTLKYSDLNPGIPLMEICGYNRVLIENHRGVAAYHSDKVSVNIKEGNIIVCGESLRLSRMNRGKLVICGKISEIHLMRG